MTLRWRLALAAPALMALTGATWRVAELGHAILPSNEPIGVERDLAPGDVIMQSPVGAQRTAVLLDDLTVTAGQHPRTLARGGALVDAMLQGRGVGELEPSALEFCTPAPPLLCVVDDDSDGVVDQVVLPDPADAAPVPIAVAPVRYAVKADVPLPGDSAVRVRFLGVSGETLRFRVELFEKSKAVGIANGGRRIRLADLPMAVSIMDGVFDVIAIEPRSQHIRAVVRRTIAPGPYTIDVHAPGLLEGVLLGPTAPGTRTLDRAPAADEAPPRQDEASPRPKDDTQSRLRS